VTDGSPDPFVGAREGLWRPSSWLTPPPHPRPTHWWHVAAIVALTGYANVVANQALSDAWDIPFNLATLAVAIGIARRSELTWPEMGLRRDRIRRGLAVGAAAMALVAIGVVVLALVPASHAYFRDDRVIGVSAGAIAFQVLIRIPLATALYEETLFRGVLFGMFARHFRPLTAALLSASLFGLWHLLPTVATLRTNPAGDVVSGPLQLVGALAAAVAGTFVAGLVFQWLRLRASSIVAPTMAHIATNGFALIAAFWIANT